METKRQLRAERWNAELRALKHFDKICQIQRVLDKAEKNKEMYYLTVKKIREIIAD